MTGNFANLDFDRMCQINAMVGTGTKQPDNLTPDEVDAWKQAERFYEMAKEKGLTVEIPGTN